MSPRQIQRLFSRLQQANPKPTTELNFSSAFELLLAVILSAQATDIRVNLVCSALFKVANTPEQIIALGEAGLKAYIKSVGLFNSKACNIIKTAEILQAQYEGCVPDTREALESLPGVGRKTANVVLNTYFGQDTMAVDTHIFRVCNRIGLAPGKTPLGVEQVLIKVVPEPFRHHAHHWLVLHGRYICKARKPLCSSCVLKDLCSYPDKTQA